MKENSIKNIRNGSIATVIGGIVLFAIPKDIWSKLFQFVVSCFKWLWERLIDFYALPGWLLIIFFILSLICIINIILGIRANLKPERPEHYSYTEGFLFMANWRWKWINNRISNLWCYCPNCDATLVFNDSSVRHFLSDEKGTKFICENCNDRVVSIIEGGDREYAIGRVEREIIRRIRTGEYKRT